MNKQINANNAHKRGLARPPIHLCGTIKAPATPTPQGQADSDQDGHPHRVKAKRVSRRAEDGMGAGIIN